MDSSACLESLTALLSQEASSLGVLAEQLTREHALLAANDVDTLAKAMAERQLTLRGILDIEDERRALCRMHGHSADVAGLERLLAWCDPHGTLSARWAECAQGATHCRELNDKNGAFVHARIQRVQAQLAAIKGQSTEIPTYGRKGAYGASRSGRVLATEA